MAIQRKNVCGLRIDPVAARKYTITDAYCTGCGKPGNAKCNECRNKEKNRIAELDAMPAAGESK